MRDDAIHAIAMVTADFFFNPSSRMLALCVQCVAMQTSPSARLKFRCRRFEEPPLVKVKKEKEGQQQSEREEGRWLVDTQETRFCKRFVLSL